MCMMHADQFFYMSGLSTDPEAAKWALACEFARDGVHLYEMTDVKAAFGSLYGIMARYPQGGGVEMDMRDFDEVILRDIAKANKVSKF